MAWGHTGHGSETAGCSLLDPTLAGDWIWTNFCIGVLFFLAHASILMILERIIVDGSNQFQLAYMEKHHNHNAWNQKPTYICQKATVSIALSQGPSTGSPPNNDTPFSILGWQKVHSGSFTYIWYQHHLTSSDIDIVVNQQLGPASRIFEGQSILSWGNMDFAGAEKPQKSSSLQGPTFICWVLLRVIFWWGFSLLISNIETWKFISLARLISNFRGVNPEIKELLTRRKWQQTTLAGGGPTKCSPRANWHS